MTAVVTVYQYATRPGVTPEAYLEAAAAVQDRLAAAPGFQYRCLARTGDGWFETVFWDSAEAADAANRTFMQDMAGSDWMGMIDMDSARIDRHPIVQGGGAVDKAA